MNRAELNRIFLNATSLNRVGSRRGASVAERWEDFLASGVDVLRISNAKANSLSSLIVGGGCSQGGTPTPSSPYAIISNKGAVSYGVLGNNLLEVTDENIVVGKYINNNGEVTTSLPNLYFQRFVAVKANTAYTLSTSETLNYANFMEYDADGVFIKRALYGSSSTAAGKVVTHTMGASTAFVIVGSNVNGTKYPEITKDNVKAIKWMFCEGSSAKTYEAYRAGYSYGGQDTISIEGGSSATASLLLGVGTYADAQDIIKGNITRKVGIKVLDGFEDITLTSGVYLIDLKDKKATNDNVLCSHFAFIRKTSVSSHTNNLTISSMANSKVTIRYNAIADVEAFRQFLQMEYAKGTPVIVVYPLASEKTESVTPVAVSNPKGEVTIVRDAEVKGLPMEATIKVKSEGGGEIEFTIKDYNGSTDYTFKAREGMTWREFCDSAYNTEGWYIDETGWVYLYDGEGWGNPVYYAYEQDYGISIADRVINPNAGYITHQEGGIGGGE